MKSIVAHLTTVSIGALVLVGPLDRAEAETRFDGVTLNIASQNDQFAAVLAAEAPKFEALTGAKVNVDILSYPELLTKITADYVGHTKGYDIATMDIVWSGQFAQAGYTVDLTPWIKRDAAEIGVADIYPSLMSALGGYGAKQVAFPFAGYANVLAYRKDLYEAAGDVGGVGRRRDQADRREEEDLRLRRQRPERSGRRAGLDAVQQAVRRVDPRRQRQAGAQFSRQHRQRDRLQEAVRRSRASRRRRL